MLRGGYEILGPRLVQLQRSAQSADQVAADRPAPPLFDGAHDGLEDARLQRELLLSKARPGSFANDHQWQQPVFENVHTFKTKHGFVHSQAIDGKWRQDRLAHRAGCRYKEPGARVNAMSVGHAKHTFFILTGTAYLMACSTWRRDTASSSSLDGIAGDHEAKQGERLRSVDVAARAGCTLRQLRRLIEEGLVPRALGAGRGAWYTEQHVVETKVALMALLQGGLSHPRLMYAVADTLPLRYQIDVLALRKASRRDRSVSIKPVRLELTCGLQLVINRSQPVEYKKVQRAVLSAIADVLEREHARVLQLRSSLRASRDVLPFNQLSVSGSDSND